MLYNALITTPIIILVLTQVFLLGKYFSVSWNVFRGNIFARFTVGAILYLGITFVVLFPFIWMQLNILWYVIIYFIKEFITYIFLILRSNSYLKDIKIKDVFTIVLFGIALTAIYNLGIAKILQTNISLFQNNKFNLVSYMMRIIQRYSSTDGIYIVEWILGIIGGSISFSVISAFIVELTSRNNWGTKAISLVLTFGLLFLVNYGYSLIVVSSIFIMAFAILLGVRIHTYMRRRYSLLLGISMIVAWSFIIELFFADVAIVVTVSLTYIYFKRPKPGIFTVQLIGPIALIASLWLYETSIAIALVLSILSVITYILVLLMGRIKAPKIINTIWMKVRRYVIYMYVFAYVVAALVILSQSKSFKNIDWYNDALFNYMVVNTSSAIKFVEIAIWSIITIILIGLIVKWIIEKKQFKTKHNLVAILAFTIILFYNPLWNVLTYGSVLKGQFQYLKGVFIIPLFATITATVITKMPKIKMA